METSYLQPKSLSSSSMFIPNDFIKNSQLRVSKVAGYLVIAGNVCFSVENKPSQKHLDNMYESFGWMWKDV